MYLKQFFQCHVFWLTHTYFSNNMNTRWYKTVVVTAFYSIDIIETILIIRCTSILEIKQLAIKCELANIIETASG